MGHKAEHVTGAVQRFAFSGDGLRLVTVGSDRKLMVWDIASGKSVYTASFPNVLRDAGHDEGRQHTTKQTNPTSIDATTTIV